MPNPQLIQHSPYLWERPRHGQMRVPSLFFGTRELVEGLESDALQQADNVACLPGIVKASLAMPDAHWGYGFLIGGVAAFDPDQGGIISVGGIGYDISCGVRTLRTGLQKEELLPGLKTLTERLFQNIPAGVGSKGSLDLNPKQIDDLLGQGAVWAVKRGLGRKEDLAYIEDNGCIAGGDPRKVSLEAKKRQQKQMGTLGSGNHYLEVQCVHEIFDQEAATAFGVRDNQILISLHCGSRGLGHQIGTDYIRILGRAADRHRLKLPRKELVCAPIKSPAGRDFYQAMVCGINCALANRQILDHRIRQVLTDLFPGANPSLVYDVSHNTCKIEEHLVDDQRRTLYVHRKGATRALGPGSPELPESYRRVGQPVLIGGTMGTSSFILAGNGPEQNQAWNSACHGAGRSMSRRQAAKTWKGKSVINELAHQGILLRTASTKGAAEEAPLAYKDVTRVVEATHAAGLARKVAELKPLACIKG